MYAVIMAGGSGTRLWPLSRKNNPKQLQQLVSHRSLIQETYDRLHSFLPIKNIFICTGEQYLAETKRHLPEIHSKNYITEPTGRNTAPASGYVAAYFAARDPKSVVATIASDHYITNPDAFSQALLAGEDAINKYPDHLITIGLTPKAPETGFGYIQLDNSFDKIRDQLIFKVKQFVEKPNLQTAKNYLKSGQYLWNASYFIWRADTMLNNFAKLAPEFAKPLDNIKNSVGTKNFSAVVKKEYSQMPVAPVDTVIFERAKAVLVIPADLGWSDIGSWASLHDILKDRTGCNIISKGDHNHVSVDTQNCFIHANNKLVATIGLNDVIIVDTEDVLLICNKNQSQNVKLLLDKLKEEGKHLYL